MLWKKYYCDRIEYIWVSLWNFFLSSIGLAGAVIYWEKQEVSTWQWFSNNFLNFRKIAKNVFLWTLGVFECWFRSLWVWYRYGWWCVGNLGPDPFQTQHDWIFIQCYRLLGSCQKWTYFRIFSFFKKKTLDFSKDLVWILVRIWYGLGMDFSKE